MSHVVTIRTRVHRLRGPGPMPATVWGLPAPATRKPPGFYAGEASGPGSYTCPGLALPRRVRPRQRRGPRYDNFNGSWGDQQALDKLLQGYGRGEGADRGAPASGQRAHRAAAETTGRSSSCCAVPAPKDKGERP